MDNKSYAKCRLCEYKGGCAFNHNGDQELCDLNVTHLDLADHDKQIRDEVIDEIENFVNGICEYPPTRLLGKNEMLDKLKRMKGGQNE